MLRSVAYGEVNMPAYALRHHEVVFLARAVDACGAQHYKRKSLYGLEPLLALQLALAVGRVGACLVGCRYLGVRLLLARRPHHAQAAQIDKAPQPRVLSAQRQRQVGRAFGVHFEEVAAVQAFGYACRMHNIVKLLSAQLLLQLVQVAQVELYKMYSAVV